MPLLMHCSPNLLAFSPTPFGDRPLTADEMRGVSVRKATGRFNQSSMAGSSMMVAEVRCQRLLAGSSKLRICMHHFLGVNGSSVDFMESCPQVVGSNHCCGGPPVLIFQ